MTDEYFRRMYPGEGYFNLTNEEFEELYYGLLDFIKDLVYYLEDDNIFKNILYKLS